MLIVRIDIDRRQIPAFSTPGTGFGTGIPFSTCWVPYFVGDAACFIDKTVTLVKNKQ